MSRWPNIKRAEENSELKTAKLAELAKGLLPTDEGSFVVFGSLARGEYTSGSDLDWTVLIDGRADSRHLECVHELKTRLITEKFIDPGPTEVFGTLVFSHDLVHAIGGEEDTNRNMTRRLLLLLESKAIGSRSSAAVHARILNAILYRYAESSFANGETRIGKIPRFLLNDVVRFWRTMAVDYANKYRARAGAKWALRNIKLRMSRKLIFVSGLFMCLSWALQDNDGIARELEQQKLVEHLSDWTRRTPLDSLASIVKTYAPAMASDIFDSYETFLGVVGDRQKRTHLEALSPDQAYQDQVFLDAREIALCFDKSLTRLLFDSDQRVTDLTQKYGIF